LTGRNSQTRMAGYKANTNPKTDHVKKTYHGHDVRVTILYKTSGSKLKCGCWRNTNGESELIVDSDGEAIPYNQIPFSTPDPLDSEVD